MGTIAVIGGITALVSAVSGLIWNIRRNKNTAKKPLEQVPSPVGDIPVMKQTHAEKYFPVSRESAPTIPEPIQPAKPPAIKTPRGIK